MGSASTPARRTWPIGAPAMTSSQADELICHVRSCGQAAEFACDRCGKPCCAEHIRHLVVERRQERDNGPGMLGALTRIPPPPETSSSSLRSTTTPLLPTPPV